MPIYSESNWCRIKIELNNAAISISYENQSLEYTVDSEIDVLFESYITINKITYKANNSKSAKLNDIDIQEDGTYQITKNSTLTVSSSSTCLVEGTLITMADGTQKKVENLEIGDLLLIYNHETGDWDYAPLLVNVHNSEEEILTNIINLYFDDNSSLRIVGEHALFDMNLNKYVYINESNIMEYIGHKFVATECINGTIDTKIITLNRVDITKELVRVYNPASVWHLNLVANNILTLSAGMVNFFDYGENLKYDEELMIKDIQKYGLYTYDDFKDYVSLEVFYAFPFKYFKVAVGKGLITFEDILMLINYYNDSIN